MRGYVDAPVMKIVALAGLLTELVRVSIVAGVQTIMLTTLRYAD